MNIIQINGNHDTTLLFLVDILELKNYFVLKGE